MLFENYLCNFPMLSEEISQFAAEGVSCFSFSEFEQRVSSSPTALKSALRRLMKKGEIAMPYQGFYVIVPPEYRSLGCRPAEQFIPDLINYLGEYYYVGLLSAAEYHGAAHHRPQVFQVMVAKPRRTIISGKVQVNFIVRGNVEAIPTQPRNTVTGILKLSTPEATAFDLAGYYRHCGWLDNVATVLSELVEVLDPEKLVTVAELSPITWVQRLGYLLESVGSEEIWQPLSEYINAKKPVRSPLLPSVTIKGAVFSKRWHMYINPKLCDNQSQVPK
jgi:predicted transcriptional regulator of viral defense system